MNYKKESKSLIFSNTKTIGTERLHVKVSLNDKCKNGHQDFAVTGELYRDTKSRSREDRYLISCGCVHDEVLRFFPELKQFIDLHLCDYLGVPMHPVANGHYHLTRGFNNPPVDSPKFPDEYCTYYRITLAQFKVLSEARNQVDYYLRLESLGIQKQWKQQADEAIKELERLTETKFIVDSVRSQMVVPKDEDIQAELMKQKGGYYTPEKIADREQQEKDRVINELKSNRDSDILKANREFEVMKAVFLAGGKKAMDNCIFYQHNNTIKFNWVGSGDKMSFEAIEAIKKVIVLPEGVIFH